MSYNILNYQEEQNYDISMIGIITVIGLGIIYLILTALSIIQTISTIEWNAINVFESNGTKVRPYFLNIFTCGLFLRLFYIVMYFTIIMTPKIFNNDFIKFKLFKIYDYIINMVFLISYSIIIGLWSSIFVKSRDKLNKIDIPDVLLLNIGIYISSILFVIMLFHRKKYEILYKILYLSMSIMLIICSYLWIYYGYFLIKQIDGRRYIHLDLENSLAEKNSKFDSFKSVIHFNTDLNTNSSLLYNDLYYSTVYRLKYKIILLTLICPISLLSSGIYYLLTGFNLINFNPFNIPEIIRTTIYIFFFETIPCLTIIYGFWSNKKISSSNNTMNTYLSLDRLFNNIVNIIQ